MILPMVIGNVSQEPGKSLIDINGNLDHIVGFGATTIDTLQYYIGIARSCINNS